MNPAPAHLFCFGLGYSARALARLVAAEGWVVSGTCRTDERRRNSAPGALPSSRLSALPAAAGAISGVTHVLVSVPPDIAGDPVLDSHGGDIAALPGLAWLGYLSTTGVYGDRGGAGSTRRRRLQPSGERGRRRVKAEQAGSISGRPRRPVHVFRLAAIYGPRSQPV